MEEQRKDLIVIDPKEIMLAQDEAGSFVFTQQAEVHLERLLRVMEMCESIYKKIQTNLGEVMDADDVKKIEGVNVVAAYRVYGSKYDLTEPTIALQGGYAKREEKFSTDSKAIDKYAKDHEGALPEGIALRARTGSVSIKLRSQKDDE